jgi:predicted nucleic acid-binding protein
VPPRLAVLDLGEAEAITLAARLGPTATIVLDDRRGRRLACDFGLVVIGSAGLLGRAKEVGLIPFVQPILLELRSAGLFLGDASMRDLLDNSGE